MQECEGDPTAAVAYLKTHSVPESSSGSDRVPAKTASTTSGTQRGPLPERTSAPNDTVCKQEQAPRKNQALQALLSTGVSKETASKLVEEAGAEECLRQVEYLRFRHPRDPAAMLVRAIRERWGPPPGGQSGGLSPGEERVRPADGDGGPDSDGLCDVDMEEIMRRARSDAEAAWEGTGPVPEMLVRIRALMLLRKAQRGEPL
jgi:hypothetical protein